MPSHLIDVRTPAEYSTGSLPGAINIEYQNIDILAQRPNVTKNDAITLYCRSGRRSAIALETLKELGWRNVRDLGSLEEARGVLEREDAEAAKRGERGEGGKEAREGAFGKLLEGLKGCER